jgi:hypothetical protein
MATHEVNDVHFRIVKLAIGRSGEAFVVGDDNPIPVVIVAGGGGGSVDVEPIEQTFTANGTSDPFRPGRGDFNITIDGAFDAKVAVARQFDGSTDWHVVITDDLRKSLPPSFGWSEAETEVSYQVIVSDFVSGSIDIRLSK